MVNFLFTKRLATSLYETATHLIPSIQSSINNRLILQQQARSSHDQPPSTSTEYLVRNWAEAMFAWIQMVLLWHDPILSIFTISSILASFLLLTYFTPKFYATIMIVLFLHNFIKVWFRHVWPEIRVPPEDEVLARLDVERWTHLHPELMTLNELGKLLENLLKFVQAHIEKLLILRRRDPIKFCSITCITLSCTALIGRSVSDISLILSSLMIVLVAPGIYLYLLPQAVKKYICKTFEVGSEKKLDQYAPDPADQSNQDPVITSTTSIYAASGSKTSHDTESRDAPQSPQVSFLSSPLTLLEHLTGSRRQEFNHENYDKSTMPAKRIDDSKDNDVVSAKLQTDDPTCSENDSPGSAASLADFDEEQQDGFVIL